MNLPKERTVYVLEVKEVISRSYYVLANSKREAIKNFELGDETDDEYYFNEDNSNIKVCQIDGSDQWHKTFKPTVDYKLKQELVVPDWASGDYKMWQFKYERGEEDDN